MLETICDVLVDAYKRNWITSSVGYDSVCYKLFTE